MQLILLHNLFFKMQLLLIFALSNFTYHSFSLLGIHPPVSILKTHSLTLQKSPKQTRQEDRNTFKDERTCIKNHLEVLRMDKNSLFANLHRRGNKYLIRR